MERFDKMYAGFCQGIATYLIGAILVVCMGYVAGNVFFRYFIPGSGGLLGMDDYVGILMVPLTFLGLSFAWYRYGGFIRVNILQDRLRGKVLWGFQFGYTLIALIIFTGVLLYGSILGVIHSVETIETGGQIGFYFAMWPWRVTMVIGSVLLAIRLILDLIRMVRTGDVTFLRTRE